MLCIIDGIKEAKAGYRLNNSVTVMALLLVRSVFDAFLSASITRSMAAENTIVAEFLTAQALSLYPSIAEIIASPTYAETALDKGASRIIKRRTFKA